VSVVPDALAADEEPPALRPYLVHAPAWPDDGPPRPLVVYLHGCTQTAADAELGTGWSELADREGFVVVYPEQTVEANGTRCWNWFVVDQQGRGRGEQAIILDIVRRVAEEHSIDPTRVYLAGASAGADMSTVIGATYPDVFAAIAPFAGCAFAACTDVTGSLARAAMGSHARRLPVLTVQGTADPLNNPAMGETAVRQWVGTNELSPTPTRTEEHGDATAVEPGGGDPCAYPNRFPCAAGATGWESYPSTVHHYQDEDGCSIVEAWYVHGLSHDYPGGNPDGSFTDPAGPDATALTWSFFQRHRRGRPCAGV
jgi:poly(hydroxyalkanoate) depolymerase family esterase